MYKITKRFTFCYGHRLYGDPGKCGNIHGHTGRVEISLCGEKLDQLGMVKNFDEIKDIVGKWIEDNLDHKMVLNRGDPLAKVLADAGEKLFLMDGNPTAENLARTIFKIGEKNGLPVESVMFWESPTSSATYQNCRGDRI